MDGEVMFMTLAGSHLYGTNTPESDVDERGVRFPPVEALIGLSHFEQEEVLDKVRGIDRQLWSLRKFCLLALDANPNILEILYAPIEGPTALVVTDQWLALRGLRSWFLSKKIARTFPGYAWSQAKKMRTHVEWLRNPPQKPDPYADYGAWQDEQGRLRWEDGHKRQFEAAQRTWEQYEKWKAERNPARAELEARMGYDGKNAMHLLRLMRQGLELLQTGHLTLPRPKWEASWLLRVRNGLYSYDALMEIFQTDLVMMETALAETELPDEPDAGMVEHMVKILHREWLLELN